MLRRCARRAVGFRWYRRPAFKSHIPDLSASKTNNEQEILLVGKDQKEVESNLAKLGFEPLAEDKDISPIGLNNIAKNNSDSLFLKYLKHFNTGFKQSNRNFNILTNEFNANPQNDKLPLLLTYFLKEANLEIRRLKNFTPEQINNLIETNSRQLVDNSIDSTDNLEQYILNDIANENNKENYLIHTNFLLKLLTNLINDPEFKPSPSTVSMEQLVDIFEFSKLIPFQQKRQQGIMCSANLIYGTGKVKMDPVNESFYINSLVAFGNYKDALKLFNARKDTFIEKWWYTIGLNILLASNNLRGFKRLLNEMDQLFPESYPYLSTKVIKFGIKKFLKIDNLTMSKELTERFLEIVKLTSLSSNTYSKSKLQMFQDDDEANQYLNQIETPTQSDFIAIINYYIYKGNMPMVSKLFQTYLDLPGINENYPDLILRTNINLLKDFNSLKALINTDKQCSTSTIENMRLLENEFNNIVSHYDTNDHVINGLLFDNIRDLSTNYKLSASIRNFINEQISENDKDSSKLPVRNTKEYNILLSNLLQSGKYEQCEEILKKLENSYRDQSETVPQVNAHIYSIFINHYHNLSVTKQKRFPLTELDARVQSILTRMNDLNVPYNSVFIATLLKYYRARKNLKSCFKIIKAVFYNGSPVRNDDIFKPNLFHRREINEALYYEVWKTYYNYYNNESRPINLKSGITLNQKLKNSFLRKQVNGEITMVPNFTLEWLLKNMIAKDNLLLNSDLYHLVIAVFIKSNNWSSLPAVICLMTNTHSLNISIDTFLYILSGLKNYYIKFEMWKLRTNNKDMTIGAAQRAAIKSFKRQCELNVFMDPKQLKRLGTLKDFTSENIVNTLLVQIFRLIKYQNPYDVNFGNVIENFTFLEVDPEQIAKIINHVNSNA
ncbi:hypothetical protein C6P45_000069 [Maudiozyma exigua]|uniref:Mitochondrial group I intron splicing factor CCM1 n=1 Tax=Maudiozyma exigua TaxID=34358 RepID=A0A9P6WFT7_MAUEX|nr:hypothetical protein C6P45_000069 [Kazachstania exigua]